MRRCGRYDNMRYVNRYGYFYTQPCSSAVMVFLYIGFKGVIRVVRKSYDYSSLGLCRMPEIIKRNLKRTWFQLTPETLLLNL